MKYSWKGRVTLKGRPGDIMKGRRGEIPKMENGGR